MKKVLCVVLTICFVWACALPAFGFETLLPDEKVTVTLTRGDTEVFEFTPPETGVYLLTFQTSSFTELECSVAHTDEYNAFLWANLFNVDDAVAQRYGLNTKPKENAYFCAEKGKKLRVTVTETSGESFTDEELRQYGISSKAKATLRIKKSSITSLQTDRVYSVKSRIRHYAFTPEKSGEYNFSTVSAVSGTGITVHDVNGVLAADNGSSVSKAFDLTVKMKKGKPYLIEVYCTDDAEQAPFDFMVTNGENIQIEKIEPSQRIVLLPSGPNDIVATVNLFVVPNGAAKKADFKHAEVRVTPSFAVNAVLYAYEDGTADLELTSRGIGIAVVRVILPDGHQCSCVAVVLPPPVFRLWQALRMLIP